MKLALASLILLTQNIAISSSVKDLCFFAQDLYIYPTKKGAPVEVFFKSLDRYRKVRRFPANEQSAVTVVHPQKTFLNKTILRFPGNPKCTNGKLKNDRYGALMVYTKSDGIIGSLTFDRNCETNHVSQNLINHCEATSYSIGKVYFDKNLDAYTPQSWKRMVCRGEQTHVDIQYTLRDC